MHDQNCYPQSNKGLTGQLSTATDRSKCVANQGDARNAGCLDRMHQSVTHGRILGKRSAELTILAKSWVARQGVQSGDGIMIPGATSNYQNGIARYGEGATSLVLLCAVFPKMIKPVARFLWNSIFELLHLVVIKYLNLVNKMCSYTQVTFQCQCLREIVREWCPKYETTHIRCRPLVVAIER